ncbi:MAG: CotH kinase family protein, partial [Polyangiaceae bacterium]|nr:CotH kinase family protein [Polyangiaceae bacterium]
GGQAPGDAAALFSGDSVARFDITLSPEAIDSLDAISDRYVSGDVTVTLDGKTVALTSVGVRLKGVFGSFRTLDEKAAFLLNFDKFTDGQRLFGLEKLALNNMVQDPSMIHERLGYALFRGVDAPASRSSYADVHVNGELYGLYATVEVVDSSELLERWFGDDGGNLYEGSYGSDFFPWKVFSFDLDRGADVDRADLNELIAALDGMTDPDTFLEEASQVIDMDRYLRFAATEIFLGHWDGYAWTRNNYFIYRRPDDGRWTFLPWGLDQTFGELLDPFGGAGRLQQMCDASLPCRQALALAFQEVAARSQELDLEGQAAAMEQLIWDHAVADPRKEVDIISFSGAVGATIQFLHHRPADVLARLVCADPSSIDEDGDGTPGCGVDCDDQDPAVHPGAPEVCNGMDDDCDGAIDDDPMCPTCVEQPAAGGGALAFCWSPLPWAEAEADCAAQGGHLASIHDQASHDEIWAAASAIAAGDWLIGLNDQAIEGDYVWTDGSPLDFTRWKPGAPNNSGDQDCSALEVAAGGQWNDVDCDPARRYVCELP